MVKAVWFGLGMVAGAVLLYFFGPPPTELEDYRKKAELFDSTKAVYQTQIDSLLLSVDSLRIRTQHTDTVYRRTFITLHNDIKKTRSINSTDSLVRLIKRSIHSRRTARD